MIEKMTRYSFILLESEKESFLKSLSDLGVVDIKRRSTPMDERSEKMFSDMAAIKEEIRCIEKGSDAHLAALLAERNTLERNLKEVAPWGEHDLSKFNALGLDIHFYCVAEKQFDETWPQEFAIQVVRKEEGKVWFVIVGDSAGFPIRSLPAPTSTPSALKESISLIDKEIKEYSHSLDMRKFEIPDLVARIESIRSELSLYLASQEGISAAENSLVTFTGFAPSSDDADLCKALDKMDGIFYMADAATEEDNPPIKLSNNRFSKLFECLTGMYGMPVYGEWDPTPVLSVFFMLFFAMCMGDAGYGLILIIYGILQDRKIVNIGMFDGLGKLISVLGIATMLIGILFGTAFGIDLRFVSWMPESVKSLFLSRKVEIAGSSYDLAMVIALGVGIFHICLAMTIKAVLYTKRFGIKENISTWGWLVLIPGGVITAILAITGILPQNIIKAIIYLIAATSILSIFVFNKPGRNPLLNIGAGLWDAYNMATGILGDTLSYIRLYALGLAGGMLGGAFNDLGSMVLGTDPSWQWIPFVLILLLGHVLNLLMSCLGAFVHPLRLTFVEYFKNSGYEGKGAKYNPIKK